MSRVVLLLALVAGCNSTSVYSVEGQDRAEAVIWRGLYAMGDEPAPPVEWRWPECETSPGHSGINSYNVAGQCVANGYYWIGGGVVIKYEGEARPDWLSLAHEWLHAKAWKELRGDADPLHRRMDWKLPLRANAAMGLVSGETDTDGAGQ